MTRSNNELLALGQRVDQLTALVEGGVPLADAAKYLAQAERAPRLKAPLRAFAGSLAQGEELYPALTTLGIKIDGEIKIDGRDRNPDGDAVCQTLDDEAGEELLPHLARHLRRKAELAIAWQRAWAYPLFITGGLIAFWLIAVSVVGPELSRFYVEIGVGSLPGVMQDFLSTRPSRILFVLFAAVIFFGLFQGLRRRLLLALPLVGTALRQIALSERLEDIALQIRRGASVESSVISAREGFVGRRRPPPRWFAQNIPSLVAIWNSVSNSFAPRVTRKPKTLGEAIAGWSRGYEAVRLIAAERHEGSSAILAQRSEAVAEQLYEAAMRSLRSYLSPVLVALVAFVTLALLSGIMSSPVFSLGGMFR